MPEIREQYGRGGLTGDRVVLDVVASPVTDSVLEFARLRLGGLPFVAAGEVILRSATADQLKRRHA